jgi:hypothetical protein
MFSGTTFAEPSTTIAVPIALQVFKKIYRTQPSALRVASKQFQRHANASGGRHASNNQYKPGIIKRTAKSEYVTE